MLSVYAYCELLKILICVQNYTTESSFHLHKILDSVIIKLSLYIFFFYLNIQQTKLAVSDKILSNSSEAFTPTIILFAKGNGIL